MTTAKYGFLFPLLLAIGACSISEPLPNTSDNWINVDAEDFSFSIPERLSEVPTKGLDSAVRRWESSDITIQSDYGRFSDPLDSYTAFEAYQETSDRIDGRATKIVSFQQDNGWNFTAVHFPDAGTAAEGKINKLTIVVEASPQIDAEIPLQNVRSVRLTRESN